MAESVISLEGLSKFYTSGQNVVVGLTQVNLSFRRGEFVAITGESGSGKSTLAHVIGGILPYESGEMYIDGHPTSHYDGKDWEHYRRDCVSFISQSYGILLSATVQENVVSALRLTGMDKDAAILESETILRKVELWELRSRRAAKLSSGQKQRLSIARALAKPAQILIADEPTGNLDPENSAKIIRLLAEAAKDRLVLLITHDFHEAADYVTRRISLQDGRITMDAALQPDHRPEVAPAPAHGSKKSLSLYVSRLQLTGRPVWFSFVLLFFALTAFAVFSFLGTFIVALDDTNTRVYDPRAFRNGDPTRIVVQRADGQPMTQADYDKLTGVSHVKALDPCSYLQDINIFYELDDHYRIITKLLTLSPDPPIYKTEQFPELLDYSHFAKAIPQLPEGQTFLKEGRLPEHAREVVLCGDASRLGETMRVYLQDTKKWGIDTVRDLDVTVVGITDVGEGLYLHPTVGQIFDYTVHGKKEVFLPNLTLSGNQCIPQMANVKQILVFKGMDKYGRPIYEPKEIGETYYVAGKELIITGFEEICDTLTVIQVSPEMFRDICGNQNDQASLRISHYAYTGRVLKRIQDMGYAAISPYQNGATTQISAEVTQRYQTLGICLGALLLAVALEIIVLRALFGSQLENYKLLANIGLTCSVAKRSVLWQILLFTLLGQILGGTFLLLGDHLEIQRITAIVRYLTEGNILLLSLVHLAAALLAALWVGRNLQKRIYPMFANRTDLPMDDQEVAE